MSIWNEGPMFDRGESSVQPRSLIGLPWGGEGGAAELLRVQPVFHLAEKLRSDLKFDPFLTFWGLFRPSGSAPGHRGSSLANSFPNPD